MGADYTFYMKTIETHARATLDLFHANPFKLQH